MFVCLFCGVAAVLYEEEERREAGGGGVVWVCIRYNKNTRSAHLLSFFWSESYTSYSVCFSTKAFLRFFFLVLLLYYLLSGTMYQACFFLSSPEHILFAAYSSTVVVEYVCTVRRCIPGTSKFFLFPLFFFTSDTATGLYTSKCLGTIRSLPHAVIRTS